MTLIVGIQCSDGVVMASDSAATLSTGAAATIGQQRVKKIINLSSSILYAATGSVGMSQLVSHAVSNIWKGRGAQFQQAGFLDGEVMKVLGSEIAQTVHPYLQTGALTRQLGIDGSGSLCKSLVALPVQKIPQLFCFDFGGQPEMATAELPFMAVGSGQPIADPFLAFLKRLFWPNRVPTLAEGRLAAVWTIAHVTNTSPGGVGGDIQLWMLARGQAGQAPNMVELKPDQIQEHLNQVSAAETALIDALTPQPARPLPEVPQAPQPPVPM